jgi:hypothetical protein
MSTNQINVSISMGEGYEPSARLRTAITEIGAALQDAHGDDTSGFAATGYADYEKISFTYQKIEWTWVVGSPLKTITSPRDAASGLPTG